MKNKNYLFSCSLWFQEQFKKIIHPGSQIQGKIIPDPDPDSRIKRVKSTGSRFRIISTAGTGIHIYIF
jgi:hypothetical protein